MYIKFLLQLLKFIFYQTIVLILIAIKLRLQELLAFESNAYVNIYNNYGLNITEALYKIANNAL